MRASPVDRTDRRALLTLAALAAALFADVLFRDRVFFERDILTLYYPQAEDFVRCLAGGSWPVWDPYIGFGQPLLANPSAQVLYPWTWLNLLLSPGTQYTVYAVSHAVLSAAGTYLLGRRLRLSAPAALLAAALWTSSGTFLSLVSLWHHFAGVAWMPWVLLAADHALRIPSIPRGLLGGAALGVQVLAGSADVVAMTLVLVAGLAWHRRARPLASPVNRRLALSALVAGGFAAALTAGQWLPAADALRASSRSSLPEGVRAFWSLHPVALVQCLLPLLPRDLPLRPGDKEALFEGREPFLNSLYLGLAMLPFVAAAFWGGRRRAAGRLVLLAALATLVALGRHGFVYGILVDLVPPLGVVRYPVKVMVLVGFAFALLAGLGLDAWRARDGRFPRSWHNVVGTTTLALGGLTLGLGALVRFRPQTFGAFLVPYDSWGNTLATALREASGSLVAAGLSASIAGVVVLVGPRWTGLPRAIGLVGVLAVADLVFALRPLNPTAPRALVSRPPPILAAIARQDPTRIYSFDYQRPIPGKIPRRPEEVHAPIPPAYLDLPPLLRSTLSLQGLLPPATGQAWGLFGSYDWDPLGLYPDPLRDLVVLLPVVEDTPGFRRLLQIGAVSYVLALHREGLEDLIPVTVLRSPTSDGAIHVFRVPDPRPRAYLVGSARVVDGVAARAALLEPGFDPAREVLLAEGQPRVAESAFTGEARLRALQGDRVVVDVQASEPGYLVLVDAFDPGWRALVDGSATAVLRANVAFRAVAVHSGRHRVELLYRPASVSLGLSISAFALALGVGYVLRARARFFRPDGKRH